MLAIRCQSKVHDNASPFAFGLTKHKARELAANPGALIHEALNLVRRRRSIDVGYDDSMDRVNRDRIANSARSQSLEEKSSGEEREHSIDKRQVPDGLGMLNDYMAADTGPLRLQQIVTGVPNEEKMNRRAKKDLHENVSDVYWVTKVGLSHLISSHLISSHLISKLSRKDTRRPYTISVLQYSSTS